MLNIFEWTYLPSVSLLRWHVFSYFSPHFLVGLSACLHCWVLSALYIFWIQVSSQIRALQYVFSHCICFFHPQHRILHGTNDFSLDGVQCNVFCVSNLRILHTAPDPEHLLPSPFFSQQTYSFTFYLYDQAWISFVRSYEVDIEMRKYIWPMNELLFQNHVSASHWLFMHHCQKSTGHTCGSCGSSGSCIQFWQSVHLPFCQ